MAAKKRPQATGSERWKERKVEEEGNTVSGQQGVGKIETANVPRIKENGHGYLHGMWRRGFGGGNIKNVGHL